MGSPDPPRGAEQAPETLARVVLRCRELAELLESSAPALPRRSEAPFLYGQLDDVLRRVQAALRPLGLEAEPAGERGPSLLRRLAGLKPREPKSPTAPRSDLEGNAWTIPVTELVGFLAHSGKSGLLWVHAPSETFALEFARGSLVHATSNNPPAAFRLGEILLRERLFEAHELSELIDLARAADDLLGSYLVRSGRLKHADLQRALTLQVQELFHRLMDATNALFRFQDGGQLLRSQGLEVNITHLLLESARKKDEERRRLEGAAPQASPLDVLEPEAALPVEAEAAPAGGDPGTSAG